MAFLDYNAAVDYDSGATYEGFTFGATDARNHANLAPYTLATIEVGKWIRNWVDSGAYTNAKEVELEYEVADVKFDGVSGTEEASVADVDTTAGGWYWDGAKLYVRGASGDAREETVVAFLVFRFSTAPKVLDSVYYEPRILTAPAISMRLENRFGGIAQVGGGNLVLANADGFFDGLTNLLWNNSRIVLKWGADVRGTTMEASGYATLGTWLGDDWSKTDDRFTLRLRELKNRADRKLPLNFYTREGFPALRENDVGTPIPIAYGRIVGATPVLIDPGAKEFKVAGHAIYSFDGVWIRESGGTWTPTTFATRDTANGEFTLGADFTGDEEVAVDFTGRKNADGSPMLNAVDIIEDLLAQAGETGVDTADFAAEREKLVLGTDYLTGREVNIFAPSVYLTETENLFETISDIAKEAGLYVYVQPDGNYTVRVFQCSPGEDLDELSELDHLTFAEDTSTDPFSKVVARYRRNDAMGFSQVETREVAAYQHAAGLGAEVVHEVELSFYSEDDAEHWSERSLTLDALRLRTWKVEGKYRSWLRELGEWVRLTYSRHGLDAVAEILEVKLDLSKGAAQLRLGHARGFLDSSGFWVDDADTLPARFSGLAGYGSGALTWNASWAPEIKAWARQNVGYWTDENGFADPDDPESHLGSVWT